MAGEMRQSIDVAKLSQYLSINLPFIKLPIEVHQFGYGQSNPTYRLRDASGTSYVLRKKPPGHLLSKSAHRIEREFRIIHALESTSIPTPKAYCLCEDAGVLDSAFYIMEYLDGRIFDDPMMPGVTPDERNEMWHNAVRVLAQLHSLKPDAVGLGDYGKSSGFYRRQLRTLSTIAASQARTVDIESGRAVGSLPFFDEIVDFLAKTEPFQNDMATLIHGDFKIDNIVFHPTEPKIIGILDWELSTVGHPLADLSNLLSPYLFAAKAGEVLQAQKNHGFRPTALTPGLPSQAQCLAWYGKMAGWNPEAALDWSNIFSTLRNSIVIQGIAARYATRQASSRKAQEIGSLMAPYGDFTMSLIEDWRRDREVRARL